MDSMFDPYAARASHREQLFKAEPYTRSLHYNVS
jgi:hypothetical protein